MNVFLLIAFPWFARAHLFQDIFKAINAPLPNCGHAHDCFTYLLPLLFRVYPFAQDYLLMVVGGQEPTTGSV